MKRHVISVLDKELKACMSKFSALMNKRVDKTTFGIIEIKELEEKILDLETSINILNGHCTFIDDGEWTLTEEVKAIYSPIIKDFIDEVNAVEADSNIPLLKLNLSRGALSPHTLEELLKGLGYTQVEHDSNGWQYDFWIKMQKEGSKTLQISGTGATFTLHLSEYERDEEIE